jgi:hypothetical protein
LKPCIDRDGRLLLSDDRVGTSARDDVRAALFGELTSERDDGDPDGESAGARTRSLGTAWDGTRASRSEGLRGCGDDVVEVPLRG